MAAITPAITITFADTGSPAITATDVNKLTAAIQQLVGAKTVTATYGAGTLALAVT